MRRGREPVAWVQMQLTGNQLLWCFENKRALLSAAAKGLNLEKLRISDCEFI